MGSGQHTLAAVALLLASGACATSTTLPTQTWDTLAAALAWDPTLPREGELRVALAFGAQADLDLFVTDPSQETVYFANTPTQTGGTLSADRTCDATAPRIERVSYATPPPGRYRVGVDFPSACDGSSDPVPFWVEVEYANRRQTQRGTIDPLVFLPIVLEFDIP